MAKHLLVFDIETIPCVASARRLLNLEESLSDDIVREKLIEYHTTTTGNPFPRQPFHQVLCISFLLCEIEHTEEGENYVVKKIKTGGQSGESEKEILEQFCGFLQKYKPKLISFNGRTFDLPVIQYRSMMHRIPCQWLYSKDIAAKWTNESHCDLIDVFSNFGASARVKMAEVCALLGIPCKQSGAGNEVLEMYNQGKIAEISTYCQEDVLCTYMLYLNHQMHKGAMSMRLFEACNSTAMQMFDENKRSIDN